MICWFLAGPGEQLLPTPIPRQEGRKKEDEWKSSSSENLSPNMEAPQRSFLNWDPLHP